MSPTNTPPLSAWEGLHHPASHAVSTSNQTITMLVQIPATVDYVHVVNYLALLENIPKSITLQVNGKTVPAIISRTGATPHSSPRTSATSLTPEMQAARQREIDRRQGIEEGRRLRKIREQTEAMRNAPKTAAERFH